MSCNREAVIPAVTHNRMPILRASPGSRSSSSSAVRGWPRFAAARKCASLPQRHAAVARFVDERRDSRLEGRNRLRALTLPFTPRFVVFTLSILFALTFATAIGASMFPGWDVLLLAGLAVFGALTLLGFYDLAQTRHAVLRNYPDLRALALHARGNPPGDAAVFLRERERRAAVLAQPARHRLSARQDGARQAAVRHAARRLCAGLRMAAPFDRAEGHRDRAVSHRGRRARLRAALFGFGLQYFGDELRRAQRQRHPRAQQRRGARRLRPRHRRGRLQPLSPRERRRHHLGNRLGLFRLPHGRTAASTPTNSPPRRPTTRSR